MAATDDAYHLVIDAPKAPMHTCSHVARRRTAASVAISLGLMAIFGVLTTEFFGSHSFSLGNLCFTAIASLVSSGPPSVEVSHVVIIRHGEKHDGDGLSEDGNMRASYLKRCMTSPYTSVALPLGRPTYVMASHGHPGKSHRPQDTASPIAKEVGVKLDDSLYFGDAAGFAERVQRLLHHGATILVAWHHNEIHSLVQMLLSGQEWKRDALGYREDWPHNCGDEAWSSHPLPGSKCYDLIWRLTLTRSHEPGHKANASDKWEVTALTSTLEGFYGDPEAPCHDGLSPTSRLTRSTWLSRFSTLPPA